MGIKHSSTKASGDKGYAAEWNDDHVIDGNLDLGSFDLETTGTIKTGDHGSGDDEEVINVCYGTGEPPAANSTTIGTIFLKYTP